MPSNARSSVRFNHQFFCNYKDILLMANVTFWLRISQKQWRTPEFQRNGIFQATMEFGVVWYHLQPPFGILFKHIKKCTAPNNAQSETAAFCKGRLLFCYCPILMPSNSRPSVRYKYQVFLQLQRHFTHGQCHIFVAYLWKAIASSRVSEKWHFQEYKLMLIMW